MRYYLLPAAAHATGATLGQTHLRPLRELLLQVPPAEDEGEVVVLDFKDIQETNGSYLRATLLWLYGCGQMAAAGAAYTTTMDDNPVPLNIYPVAANLSREVVEQMEETFAHRELPCLEALTRSESADVVKSARLHGVLERTLKRSLQSLMAEQTATAKDLCDKHPDEEINITAWNNRLAELHKLRLARRSK